jgi:hypothetical protein
LATVTQDDDDDDDDSSIVSPERAGQQTQAEIKISQTLHAGTSKNAMAQYTIRDHVKAATKDHSGTQLLRMNPCF